MILNKPKAADDKSQNVATNRCSQKSEPSQSEPESQSNQPTALKDEWWQLFDTQTKRFYYYNAKKELTQWTRPCNDENMTDKERSSSTTSSGSSSLDNIDSDDKKSQHNRPNTTICLLASKLMSLLASQIDIDREAKFDELLEKTKLRLVESNQDSNSDRLAREIQILDSLLALSESAGSRDQFFQSFKSYLTGSMMSTLDSAAAPTSARTPRQPRTNPNYINVNLVDKQNGSLLKNTYVRLQEIVDGDESTAGAFKLKRLTTADSQMAAVLLMTLLSGDGKTCKDPETKKPAKITPNKQNAGSMTSGKSLISCFMNTSDVEPASKRSDGFPAGSATTSLTRKTIEKKFSFLTSHNKEGQSKSSAPTKSSNDLKQSRDDQLADQYKNSTIGVKSSRQQQQALATAAAAVAAAVAKSAPTNPLLDESITTTTALETSSLDLLSDDNTTLSPTPPPIGKLLINATSVSSLAEPNTSSPSQINHKLKNLRRSFNSAAAASTNKTNIGSISGGSGASLLSSSSSSHIDKGYCHNLPSGFMNTLDKENYRSCGDNQSSPGQPNESLVRKTSESNLLYIKTQIDLNVHHEKKLKSGLGGLLFFSTRKRIADHDLMVWTSQTIEKPLIKTNNKTIKKEACELFKLIQCYMGDRKSSSSSVINTPENSLRLKSSRSAAFITSPPLENHQLELIINQNPHKDITALEIMSKGWQHAQLRDELYLQIIKQTTSNLNRASCLLGWQLMALCLSFFPPTQKLYPFLGEYIVAHMEGDTGEQSTNDATNAMLAKLARACMRRLERIHVTGAKKGLKAPTIEEIILSKSTILQASLFGTTLEEIMSMQRKKCPNLQLPWIQTVLSEAVIRLNGARTEGIFRVPGDLDEVNNLKVKLDQLWCSEQVLSEHDVDIELMQSIQDPHLPASLLKLWYRELHEPLIPNEFYDECICYCDQPDKCLRVINEKLPQINRLVFGYLIKFLKVFAAPDNVAVTKMDANNLSMVMAPNCLRCKSNDPKTIMENTKKEMQFIKTMIQHLDTDSPLHQTINL